MECTRFTTRLGRGQWGPAKLEKQCFGCQEVVAGKVKTCGNCFFAIYCSVECQRYDWKNHKGQFCEEMGMEKLEMSVDRGFAATRKFNKKVVKFSQKGGKDGSSLKTLDQLQRQIENAVKRKDVQALIPATKGWIAQVCFICEHDLVVLNQEQGSLPIYSRLGGNAKKVVDEFLAVLAERIEEITHWIGIFRQLEEQFENEEEGSALERIVSESFQREAALIMKNRGLWLHHCIEFNRKIHRLPDLSREIRVRIEAKLEELNSLREIIDPFNTKMFKQQEKIAILSRN